MILCIDMPLEVLAAKHYQNLDLYCQGLDNIDFGDKDKNILFRNSI